MRVSVTTEKYFFSLFTAHGADYYSSTTVMCRVYACFTTDTESLHTLFKTEPIDIDYSDNEYTSHDPLHGLNEALPWSHLPKVTITCRFFVLYQPDTIH